MKSALVPIASTIVCLLSGCAGLNPNATYVKQHPELTEAQKKMVMEKKITSGTDVAGLTKAEVLHIMGREPNQYTKSSGVDAWVYEKEVQRPVGNLAPQLGDGPAAQMGIKIEPTDPEQLRQFKVTTIFFNGDVATHAELTLDQHPRN